MKLTIGFGFNRMVQSRWRLPSATILLRIRPHLMCCQYHGANHVEVKKSVDINGCSHHMDGWTNVTRKTLSLVGANKHLQKHHPLSILRKRIINYFYDHYRNSRGNPLFSVYDNLNPIVSVQQNFDSLLIPSDHVSRSKSDCYYINQDYLLRAHMTAHQFDLICNGLDNFLMVGDVYRRDQIDSNHYPVFHQMDGVRLITKAKLFERNPDLDIFEKKWKANLDSENIAVSTNKCLDQSKQPCHSLEAVKLIEHELKQTLLGLTKNLFGIDVQYRWVDTHFPFTQPSWELEIRYRDIWMEVLGCGIMRHEILQRAGVEKTIGYAFGLGLERLAMILFDIPDIRLFWTKDSGFLSQFNEDNIEKFNKYTPISIYPQCKNDLSFWLPVDVEIGRGFHPNDFYDLARSVAGNVVEQIILIDQFQHPQTKRSSLCFRIIYRHMERTLTQAEAGKFHALIANACVKSFNVEIR